MLHRKKGQNHITNDSYEILGENITIKKDHMKNINATKKVATELQTQKDHRRRINKIIQFWLAQYPDYHEVGTRMVTREEANDEMNFIVLINKVGNGEILYMKD